MLPRTLVVTPSSSLVHEFDVEARIAACPKDHAVKGMFFTRLVEMALRSGVKPSEIPLARPVDGGRYVAFLDYPLVDYVRWSHAAGRRLHPRVATSEALRRVGREDFKQFLASGVGKVMAEFMNDARSVVVRSGQIYGLVVKGPRVASHADGDDIVVEYRNYHGPVECYPVGTLEGACRHFGVDYTITVDVRSPYDADYRITFR